MTFALTWLPSVLEQAGLKVAETEGWRTRGRGPMGPPRGVICHHTATSAKGNMPSLNLLKEGRSDLAGPLAQLGLGRDGTFYVVAAGRANHAGMGNWKGLNSGNWSFIGIEAENDGRQEVWPDVQLDAYRRGVAAILKQIGADPIMCCGHKEWAPGRKIDPHFDMMPFRRAVADLLLGKSPPPPIAALDAQDRDTLRRGMIKEEVKRAQRLLGIEVDGIFGGKTEATLRAYQREHGLVPDGILGPASWHSLEPGGPPAGAAAPQGADVPHAVDIGADGPRPTTPPGLPAADDASHAPRSDGINAFGLDGKIFARRVRRGFMTAGVTTLPAWLKASGAPNTASNSVVRVVKAMSVNEGRFEAVNSYDRCTLSFGILQWTAGKDDAPGELAVLLDAVKQCDKATFDECFGRFRLDVTVNGPTGRLVLEGRELLTSVDKDQLRDVVWAYRFWRAGHFPAVRAMQFKLAADRIADFKTRKVCGQPLLAWMSSEFAIALILDEQVNRPSDVPGTLQWAIEQQYGTSLPDPTTLSAADEAKLIDSYLEERAETSMTDSEGRASRIRAAVDAGELSELRHSFV